ncbi:MAG: matrixin family metalloprotease, partial [Sulfitobacter sp.]|nr:matrixin family metalloprotease [Sulfitobacter sp.]
MVFSIRFDYRFDTSGFFDAPGRRAVLEAAAQTWEGIIGDDFAPIPVGATFEISNPSNSAITETIITTEPIDDIVVFVGARSLPGATAAVAGPAGYSITGDIYRARIDSDWRGIGPVTDFEPWAGTIAFDPGANWHNDLSQPAQGNLDLYTIALHEIGHVLGIGTSATFDALVTAGFSGTPPTFIGVNALALNGGEGIPLDAGLGHIEEGFAGNSVVLDPFITTGTRLDLSAYDKAVLADIGYEVVGYTSQGTRPPLATDLGETINGTGLGDAIDALAGADVIFGNAGDDSLAGGAGADSLYGEMGNDTLTGGTQADQLSGQEGSDSLTGDGGNDSLWGGEGDDTLRGGADDDQVSGNAGADLLFGDGGEDRIFGGAGDDRLEGGAGADTLQAGDGGDRLDGGAGDDDLYGQDGVDSFYFGPGGGSDRIFDFDIETETLVLYASGFGNSLEAIDAISKPFTNVSRLTLGDGSFIDIYHSAQSDTPLTEANLMLLDTPPNSPPTGALVILGLAEEGQSLTVDSSGLADAEGLGPLTFQWFRNKAATGATGPTYDLTAADRGSRISVEARYTDGAGRDELVHSAPTAIVIDIEMHPAQGAPAITGVLQQGQTVRADISTIADSDGFNPETILYQWLRDGMPIIDATTDMYLLTQADVGKSLTITTRFEDFSGSMESLISVPTGPVENL